jgi:uncharacterized membrane protein YqjE
MDSQAPVFVIFALIGLISLAILIVWIWSLIHCIQNRYLSENNRVLGIILIALLGIIGSIVYLFLPRESTPQR